MDLFRKKECQILRDEIKSLHRSLDGREEIIKTLRAEVSRLTSVESKCFADGEKCGWHKQDLKSGRCPVSERELVKQLPSYKMRRGVRITGSQYVQNLERQSLLEGDWDSPVIPK